jgi:hypothetical protein
MHSSHFRSLYSSKRWMENIKSKRQCQAIRVEVTMRFEETHVRFSASHRCSIPSLFLRSYVRTKYKSFCVVEAVLLTWWWRNGVCGIISFGRGTDRHQSIIGNADAERSRTAPLSPCALHSAL